MLDFSDLFTLVNSYVDLLITAAGLSMNRITSHFTSYRQALVVVFIGVFVLSETTWNPSETSAADPVLVTIGKETTYITEPLKPSGYPDYIEALNQLASKGVTPENNAAVVLLRVLGPKGIEDDISAEYYRRLGISPLQKGGSYFVSYEDFIKGLSDDELAIAVKDNKTDIAASVGGDAIREQILTDIHTCCERPWKAEKFPHVAKWLKEQEEILKRLEALHKMPHYYSPFVTPANEPLVINIRLPLITNVRTLARYYTVRAMGALGRQDFQSAWNDVEMLLRLSQLIVESPMLVDKLISIAIAGFTHPLIRELVTAEKLSGVELAKFQAAHQQYAPKMSLVKSMNTVERFSFLRSICTMAEHGLDVLDALGGKKRLKELKGDPFSKRKQLNYDMMLKLGNAKYDELVRIHGLTDPAEKIRAIEVFEAEVKKLVKENGGVELIGSFFTAKDVRSKTLGNIYLTLFLPALNMSDGAKRRFENYFQLAELGFSLRRYREKHQRYPDKLEQLVPEYIAAVPKDQHTQQPFAYRTDGTDFLLYTIGHDKRDLGGFEGSYGGNDFSDDFSYYTSKMKPQPPKVSAGDE